ncbi:DUF2274 domain-containing protein [Acidiphilium iwatense]|uniref:DUF2274 domain-containing protein n=1 Tax=Acidiphilium iwatense TaxID=768198 RepID=A0ABS9E1L3_9PROT|nr:DUF2274 domain-containing protein [Acidiphilium iwatense]MCF3947816.1 DUF2274 domain-containing protein [Acidiphilium iwatense]
MTELKLAKLPDRTPVKITITVSPELNQALRQYAEIYRATYGAAESVADLIPFMLGAFLDSDKGFAKARKSITDEMFSAESAPRTERRRKSAVPEPSSISA